MEKLELSPMDLKRELNWSKSNIYYWISSGKFETIERNGDTKVVISQEDINRLRKQENFKNSETVLESSNNSQEFPKNEGQNVTKDYKKIQELSNLESLEFFNNALDTIKEMHKSTLQSYGYNMKLLTDGHSALEQENFELKAQCKTVSESFEKYKEDSIRKYKEVELSNKIKNIIILVLIATFLVCMWFINFR